MKHYVSAGALVPVIDERNTGQRASGYVLWTLLALEVFPRANHW